MPVVILDFKKDFAKAFIEPLIDRIENPEPALERIGLFLQGQTLRGFGTGSRGGEVWAPTMNPNLAALAVNISAGKSARERHLGGIKKPLIDSGNLRQSIASKSFYTVKKKEVIVGTKVAYAWRMQHGGKSIIENKIPELLKSGDKNTKRQIAKVKKVSIVIAGILSKQKIITINVIARKFLMITPEDMIIIIKTLKKFFVEGII